MCMDNFKMIIITENNDGNQVPNEYDLNGHLLAISPNETCQSDEQVCEIYKNMIILYSKISI